MKARVRQGGIALFVCLALLLVLGIAGVSGVRTTILEQRMARNLVDADLAFQAAEAALRQGEAFLAESIDSTDRFTAAGTDGLWMAAAPGEGERWAQSGNWDPANGGSVAVDLDMVAAKPRYMIEWIASLHDTADAHLVEQSEVADAPPVEVFRVTARAVGRTTGSRVMLQSTYGLRF